MADRGSEEASGLRPEATPAFPETIDWEHAQLLSATGTYVLIYRVAEGLVAKVGFIEPEEADLQQCLDSGGRPARTLPAALRC